MKNLLLFISILGIILSCATRKDSENNSAKETTINEEKLTTVYAGYLKPQTLTEYVEISGKLDGIADVMVVSEVSGKVERVFHKLGDWVNKGDSVGIIDNEVIRIQLEQAQTGLLTAEIGLENAELNHKASQKLFNDKKISKSESDQSLIALKSASIQVLSAKQGVKQLQRQLESSLITAPVAGYIAELPARKGDYINYGTPVCRIVDSKKLVIRTGIGESEISKLKKNNTVSISSRITNKVYTGKVTGIGVALQNGSSNYPIEIELENDGSLYSGMVVQIKIASAVYKDVLSTGLNAISTEFDTNYLFTVVNDTVIKKQIILGKNIRDQYIIESGVEEGDLIILEGTENIQDQQKVQVNIANDES